MVANFAGTNFQETGQIQVSENFSLNLALDSSKMRKLIAHEKLQTIQYIK